MHFKHLQYLRNWKDAPDRKPLILRGARQVGKTHLVRSFGKESFQEVVELNFEEQKKLVSLFRVDNLDQTLALIRSATKTKLEPGRSLLFLDEIQAAAELIPMLRYFYEKLPELHIIATGSLLEFALEQADFSMPVGRVEFLYLGPVSFSNYLKFRGEAQLADFLASYSLKDSIPEFIHEQLCNHLIDYSIIGGMPEAIANFHAHQNDESVEKIKSSILQTYESDFSKYRGRVDLERIQTVFHNSVASIGKKYVYTRIDRNENAQSLRRALELLVSAQVYSQVFHTSAAFAPLSSGVNTRIFKVLFLDCGLLAAKKRISLAEAHANYSREQRLNSDFLRTQAEQFIGQHLLYNQKLFQRPELYYWVREKKGSSAELDYLQYHTGLLYPVEVKADAPGRLRSLQIFLKEKQLDFGLRYSMSPPYVNKENYVLLSLPHYLVEEQERLVKEAL